MTTMDDLGEADDYGKKFREKYYMIVYIIHILWIVVMNRQSSWLISMIHFRRNQIKSLLQKKDLEDTIIHFWFPLVSHK